MYQIALTLILVAVVESGADPADEVAARFSPGFSRRAAVLRAGAESGMPDHERLRLAEDYIIQARAFGHSASVNVARSLLEPTLAKREVPASALLLAGGIMSYRHEFEAAHSFWQRASVCPETRDEALLQMISLHITCGDYAQARGVLTKNPALLGERRALALLTLLSSLTGELESSYKLLLRQIDSDTTKVRPEDAYLRGILGEMAERLGLRPEAETHYKTALAANGPDLFLANAYIAFLLDADRRSDAVAFIERSPLRNELTLWKEIASPNEKDLAVLTSQFSRPVFHDRELCIFLLRVKRDANAALDVALRNWSFQKEAIDTRLVLECAAAANRWDAAASVKNWIQKNRQEDFRTKQFLAKENE